MQNYLSELLALCTNDSAPPKDDPEYREACETFFRLEDQLKTTMGFDFINDYSEALHGFRRWEYENAFLQGLRLGVWFSRAVPGEPLSSV